VEPKLKFRAPVPAASIQNFSQSSFFRLHSPGCNQLLLEMNNVVFTNAIAFVFFVRFVLTKLSLCFISIEIISNDNNIFVNTKVVGRWGGDFEEKFL